MHTLKVGNVRSTRSSVFSVQILGCHRSRNKGQAGRVGHRGRLEGQFRAAGCRGRSWGRLEGQVEGAGWRGSLKGQVTCAGQRFLVGQSY